jgi:hypothetical protein
MTDETLNQDICEVGVEEAAIQKCVSRAEIEVRRKELTDLLHSSDGVLEDVEEKLAKRLEATYFESYSQATIHRTMLMVNNAFSISARTYSSY